VWVATVMDLNWRGGLRTLWNVSAVWGMLWLIFTKRWEWIVGSLVLGVVLGLVTAAWSRRHPHPSYRPDVFGDWADEDGRQ
jgi:hypothetical protein